MSSIKKRQHYVWRRYLKPWSKKGQIWTYIKESGKIFESGLMGVAQEKYFYELVDLDDDQKIMLKQFIDHTSHSSVQPLAEDFFHLFTSHNTLRQQLEKAKLTKRERDKLSEELKKIKINMMEDVHGKFESFGHPLLNCSSIADLKNLTDSELVDTVIFICIQFMRTRATKESVLKSFESTKYSTFAEKSWNIISFVMALNMARGIYVSGDKCFRIYRNDTSEKFITGDQPSFNILKDKRNEKGNVEELELYYPLSPTLSLLIYFNSEDDKFQEVEIDEEQVIIYNELVYENSAFFVFSTNRKQLSNL